MKTNKLTSSDLEYHIDAPIKKSIAMLNLLGYETYFCCAGYDYEGHTGNGHAYISIKLGDFVDELFLKRIAINVGWDAVVRHTLTWTHTWTIEKMYPSEQDVLNMEKELVKYRYDMDDEVVLKNAYQSDTFIKKAKSGCTHKGQVILPNPEWTPTLLNDWVIKKSEIFA